MAKIAVVAVSETEPEVGYEAPTCLLVGRATSRRMSPPGNPLWLVTAAVEPGSALVWDGKHGDEAVYVKTGALRIGDRTCPEGGVLVVEAGVALEARVPARAELIHFGPVDAAQPADGPHGPPQHDGHRAHIIGPRGVNARRQPKHLTKFFADGTCPTCRLSLLWSSHTEKYRSAAHSHSQDELIHVLEGELLLGSYRIGPGDTLAVPANVRYRFETGERGYGFLNYSPDSSVYQLAADEPPRRDETPPPPFVYTGDGGDYRTS
ncbi:MAG TPA: cupin domain-containing protein [Acidimicrobiales bacterium]|nr:cupin domain-containing protein [Acidimicrobiales bacterium]